jgi:2-oxoglutarate ferredoxin oxidoreductase subunit delta
VALYCAIEYFLEIKKWKLPLSFHFIMTRDLLPMMHGQNEAPPSHLQHEGHRLQSSQLLIYRTWCKACGICINLCPTDVLAGDDEGRVYIARADDCTSCKICEIHCPDFAINVVGPRPKKEAPEAAPAKDK